jgi:uncharacterized membrane protein
MNKLMQLPNYVKIILVVAILFGLLYVFSPNSYKTFYRLFKKELVQQETVSKKVYDSLEKVRLNDISRYEELVNEKDLEIEDIRNELIKEQQRAYRYEKELNRYRNSDFDSRFGEFSNTYNPKD